jgi:2-polyprenyl-3-methyl-5-hydroxy-6-metoxy-1,4-benzoquinol methylase
MGVTIDQQEDTVQRDALIERLLDATCGVWDIFAVYLGDQLGLYRALKAMQPATSGEIASLTGCSERYVREWLELQAMSGIVVTEDLDCDDAGERRFRLPAGHAEVLTDRESLNFLAPLAQIVVGAVRPIHAVRDAFRTGAGVPFADYGEDLRRGQAGMNRGMFLHQLGQEYLPAIPDIHARFQADPPARIADIGCGLGWSSIGMAQAYPTVLVDGFDLDLASVEEAQTNVAAAGLEARVNIRARDAADATLAGRYDLVTAFECVHDMSDPVGALRSMRRLAGERGTVLVVDERVREQFTPDGNDLERLMYGFSVLHCLPAELAEQPSVGTGTVMRPSTLRGYAREAGFRDIEILPLENFFFTFYRLIG